MDDENNTALEFLHSLETRHQQVLDELDELNARIEQVLDEYSRSRKPANPSTPVTESPAAEAA